MLRQLLGFPLPRERFSDAGAGAGPAGIYEEETLPLAAPAAAATTAPDDNGSGGSLVVRMLRQADETLFGGGGGSGSGGDEQAPRRPGGGGEGAARPPPLPSVVALSAASGAAANAANGNNGNNGSRDSHFSASVVTVGQQKPAAREAGGGGAGGAGAGPATATVAALATSAAPSAPAAQRRSLVLPAVYGLANLSSVIAIVVANKLALKTHGFSFPVALTWCHTAFTALGMTLLARLALFERKGVPRRRAAPVACVYVGFLVLNNLSIQLNTVGFYQVSKIAITPVIVAIERVCYGKKASGRVLAATAVLLSGVLLCSVSDAQVAASPLAALVAAANVLVSALYQVWASTKQRELGVDGMQLLHQIAPPAVLMLGVMVPLLEPVGWGSVFGGGAAATTAAAAAAAATTAAAPLRPTLLTFDYTAPALFWIGLSSVLGLVVTATTFLFIGATSSLTYNVVGHLKTVGIVSAGVLFFREALSARRLVGLGLAMSGIVWYSQVKMQEQAQEQQEQEVARRRGGGAG
jgi:solute carrier family 35 protein E3